MKMISDEHLRIGWNEVFDVLAGIMLVLNRCFKSMDDVPAGIYIVSALFSVALGVACLVYYRGRRKEGKRRSLGFIFSALFILWGVSFMLNAFSS